MTKMIAMESSQIKQSVRVKGAPIDRMSENRYFDKFLSHKFFNTNNRFSGSCILGQPVKM